MRINRDYMRVLKTGRRLDIYKKENDSGMIVSICLILAGIIILIALPAQAVEIDMDKIKMIESSGNPKAHNKKDDSRGLYQITPVVLKEWNNFHPAEQYTSTDLWSATINFKIADWYMSKRIPQMLKHFKAKDTIENRLIAYNAGISYVVHSKPLPTITKLYLKKYKEMN